MCRAMRWTLFQRVMVKLSGLRELDVAKDASGYAELLLSKRPEIFAEIDGGPEGMAAEVAANVIASDHVGHLAGLPRLAEQLQSAQSSAFATDGERLVRLSALAYLSSDRDLIRDDLPSGYGLVDDCITIRGALLATPRLAPPAQIERERLAIRYLSLAVPAHVLPEIEAALIHAAELALACERMPSQRVNMAIMKLIQDPPSTFPAELDLPIEVELDEEQRRRLSLPRAKIVELHGMAMTFEYADGERIHRASDGSLKALEG